MYPQNPILSALTMGCLAPWSNTLTYPSEARSSAPNGTILGANLCVLELRVTLFIHGFSCYNFTLPIITENEVYSI